MVSDHEPFQDQSPHTPHSVPSPHEEAVVVTITPAHQEEPHSSTTTVEPKACEFEEEEREWGSLLIDAPLFERLSCESGRKCTSLDPIHWVQYIYLCCKKPSSNLPTPNLSGTRLRIGIFRLSKPKKPTIKSCCGCRGHHGDIWSIYSKKPRKKPNRKRRKRNENPSERSPREPEQAGSGSLSKKKTLPSLQDHLKVASLILSYPLVVNQLHRQRDGSIKKPDRVGAGIGLYCELVLCGIIVRRIR